MADLGCCGSATEPTAGAMRIGGCRLASPQSVCAVTVAERGEPSITASSPTTVPAQQTSITTPARFISTSPAIDTCITPPGSPSRTMRGPVDLKELRGVSKYGKKSMAPLKQGMPKGSTKPECNQRTWPNYYRFVTDGRGILIPLPAPADPGEAARNSIGYWRPRRVDDVGNSGDGCSARQKCTVAGRKLSRCSCRGGCSAPNRDGYRWQPPDVASCMTETLFMSSSMAVGGLKRACDSRQRTALVRVCLRSGVHRPAVLASGLLRCKRYAIRLAVPAPARG